LNYFFLDVSDNGPLLHKSLHINRGADTITTWCYPLHKRVAYTYSDVRKNKQPAFSTKEAGRMLNRGRLTLEHAILRGDIEAPQFTYGLNEHKRKVKYMWHEANILEAHAYLSTLHHGRPRNDGLVTPAPLPSVRELRAMIRQEEMLFIRRDDGTFVPVWKAPDFN
jgi:hypothetical protein